MYQILFPNTKLDNYTVVCYYKKKVKLTFESNYPYHAIHLHIKKKKCKKGKKKLKPKTYLKYSNSIFIF